MKCDITCNEMITDKIWNNFFENLISKYSNTFLSDNKCGIKCRWESLFFSFGDDSDQMFFFLSALHNDCKVKYKNVTDDDTLSKDESGHNVPSYRPLGGTFTYLQTHVTLLPSGQNPVSIAAPSQPSSSSSHQ